jgi:type III secretion protein C
VASLLKSMLSVRESRNATRTLLTDLQRQELPIPPPVSFGANSGATTGGAGGAGGLGPIAGRRQAVGGAGANVGPGVAVEGDVRTNTIVIVDVPSKRAYYQRLIDALDTPQRLVEIEAYIIDVNRERVAELGVDFAAGGTRAAGAVSAAAALGRGSLSGTTLVLQGLQNFFARLRALEVTGDARVLAKPSISTLENLVAVLDLSQTVYIRSTGERVASVTPVTAGTLLRVTPRVIDTGTEMQVHLTVDIEDGKVANPLSAAQTPEVVRSNISTQAMLQNEESLVIGGYNIDSSAQSTSAVPGASRVPLFGGLFSSTQSIETSRQRLFIITPRVVASAHDRRRRDEAMRQREVDGVGATRAKRELGVEWLPADGAPPEYDVRIRGH